MQGPVPGAWVPGTRVPGYWRSGSTLISSNKVQQSQIWVIEIEDKLKEQFSICFAFLVKFHPELVRVGSCAPN
eukprot:1371612-Rhodomonas_salina.1